MLDFFNRLAQAIRARNSLFECCVVAVGSSYEGTKIDYPDKYDVNFVLARFSSLYEVVTSSACPPGFVHLRRNAKNIYLSNCQSKALVYSRIDEDDMDACFSTIDCKYLNTMAVRREFERLVKKILREAEFWAKEKVFDIDMKCDRDLYVLRSEAVGVTIKLAVNAPIDGVHIFHTISVDIVPSLHIEGFWPEECIKDASDDLKTGGCHLILDGPHKLYPWMSNGSIPYACISFARAESHVIRSASPAAKAAFMISKHIIVEFRLFHDFGMLFTTHLLKIALFHCLASKARDKTKRTSYWSSECKSQNNAQCKITLANPLSRDYSNLINHDLYELISQLFFHVLQLRRQCIVPSYFLTGYRKALFCDEHNKFRACSRDLGYFISAHQTRVRPDLALLQDRWTVAETEWKRLITDDILPRITAAHFKLNDDFRLASIAPIANLLNEHALLLSLFYPGSELKLASVFANTKPSVVQFQLVPFIDKLRRD
jgi:hypothetical protein